MSENREKNIWQMTLYSESKFKKLGELSLHKRNKNGFRPVSWQRKLVF